MCSMLTGLDMISSLESTFSSEAPDDPQLKLNMFVQDVSKPACYHLVVMVPCVLSK